MSEETLSEYRQKRLFFFQTILIAISISSKKSQCFRVTEQTEVITARRFLSYQDETFVSFLVSVWEWYTDDSFLKSGKEDLRWWLEHYINKNILGGK